MASAEAFADTSALYAAVDARDAYHRDTAPLVRQLAQAGRMIITTDYIVAETLNLAVARRGKARPREWENEFARSFNSRRLLPGCASSGSIQSGFLRPKHSSASTPITTIPLPIAPASSLCANCEFAMP